MVFKMKIILFSTLSIVLVCECQNKPLYIGLCIGIGEAFDYFKITTSNKIMWTNTPIQNSNAVWTVIPGNWKQANCWWQSSNNIAFIGLQLDNQTYWLNCNLPNICTEPIVLH